MSRQVSVTIICDNCGRTSTHIQMQSGFHEQIYTQAPFPADWTTRLREGGGAISPKLDYCPACKGGK